MGLRKLHQKAGIIAGLFLLILSLTGFFLNHDQWKFQYHWTLPNSILPDAVVQADKKLFQTKTTQANNPNWWVTAGLRGAFVSQDGGLSYQQTSNHQFYALSWLDKDLYAATEDGLYKSLDSGLNWRRIALEGQWINALAIDGNNLLVSVDKSKLLLLNPFGEVLKEAGVDLPATELAEGITLSRFVRDFHYGRGFLDDGWSLLLNDIATWILLFSALSGFFIWWSLRQAKKIHRASRSKMQLVKKTMSVHSHSLVLLALPFLMLFAITGILLDHSKFFNPYLKEITWSQSTLPPVYSSLREDIWSIDIESLPSEKLTYRIGNRYGVYESPDLKDWKKVSNGFAYRMKRLGDTLYVSGMGSPPRSYNEQGGWQIIKAPGMFRDTYQQDQAQVYFGGHGQTDKQVPLLENSTFYSIMLTLHDGTFFAEWWVWVNDFASILLILLLVTGFMRWKKKRHSMRKIFK
ncbi:MAG: hypothetical protein ISEC1_P0424 [Thiomicrorhabdus sp.]|nr:MAG: hypothetical protein ISEC1_P0424 [Thiomicrorhabdus sp.]